ncbi:uncharacterized protein LOC141850794 [Brevipalpus obovatus]|uniref:uncharacterized protein LOC141850794 n=1 Tax=Brevipalpus obovatus TaxID=246614 RepID=UPI003D9F7C38
MTFLSSLVRFCGYFICFLGCTYQMYTVVSQYLQYEVVMESLIFRPEFFLPPDVSICLPFLQIINHSLALTKFIDVKKALLHRLGPQFDCDRNQSLEVAVKQNGSLLELFYDLLLVHHSIGEIMSVTNGLDSMLIECVSLVPGQYALGPCMNTTKFGSFVKDDLKCFQFKLDGDRYKYDLEQLYYWQHPHAYLYRIKFANIDLSLERIVIYIHPPNRWPAARTDPPLIINSPTQKSGYNITFSRSYSQLLPAPYQSDCRNYQFSRNQEIDQCSLDKMRNWNGVAPPWLTLPSNSSYRTFRRTVMTVEEFIPYNEVALQCFSEFTQPDCVTEEFKPQLTAVRLQFANGSFGIDVNLPTSLDVENYMRPARTKIDLFVYIVSLLGFWFGIHVSTFFHAAKKLQEVTQFRSRSGKV